VSLFQCLHFKPILSGYFLFAGGRDMMQNGWHPLNWTLIQLYRKHMNLKICGQTDKGKSMRLYADAHSWGPSEKFPCGDLESAARSRAKRS
jgi:hypothetical protein